MACGAAPAVGLQGLAQALGGGGVPPGPGAGQARSAAGEADDARTMAVRFDDSGNRHKEFAAGLEGMSEDNWGDGWPVKGPRTTRWVCRHIAENSRTPL